MEVILTPDEYLQIKALFNACAAVTPKIFTQVYIDLGAGKLAATDGSILALRPLPESLDPLLTGDNLYFHHEDFDLTKKQLKSRPAGVTVPIREGDAYPQWRRVLPSEGAPITVISFNFDLIKRFAACFPEYSVALYFVPNGSEGACRVYRGGCPPELLGVIMPRKSKHFELDTEAA